MRPARSLSGAAALGPGHDPPPRERHPEPRRRSERRRAVPAGLRYAGGALLLFLAGAGLARFVPSQRQAGRSLEAQIEAERQALSAAIEAARRARDWEHLAQRAERLLSLPESPAHPHERARAALDEALAEQRNLLAYDRFLQAAQRRAPAAAVLRYAELSPGSIYRELGAARYQEVRRGFVRQQLDRAQGELSRLGCRAAQPHIDAILAVDPEAERDERVLGLRARCAHRAEPRAAGPRARAAAPGGVRAAALTAQLDPPAKRPEPPQLDLAQQAYISGDYRQAIRIAQQHTGRDPARAWRVIGGAACYLGDEGLIRQTLDHLDDPSQQFVRQVCQRNGIVP